MAQQLKKVEATPDDSTWAQIAARQSRRNTWLRLRYYAAVALPVIALLMLAVAGWWYWTGADAPGQPVPGTSQPSSPRQEITPENKPPVATLEPASDEAYVYAPQTSFSQKYPARFASRLNTVPAAAVRFRAETGLDYESPSSGTRVHIPANGLVDGKGMPARGEVELVFREYRDIADYLASGIPMHYGDERGSFFFNSGGMFEVRINQNGETLQMAPGQTYDLTFSPTNELENASLYYLDDATGAWKYQPDPAFGKQGDPMFPPVVSEEVAARNNKGQNPNNCLPDLPELAIGQDPAACLMGAVQTGFDLAKGKIKMPLWFRKNPGLNEEQLLNGLERGLVHIVRHRDLAELFFPEDINNVFTELKAFKDCYFVKAPDSLEGIFDPKAGEYWHRISIYKEAGSLCHFWLYGEQGLIEFYANLTASTGNKNFDAEKIMAEYQRLRAERMDNFEKTVRGLHQFMLIAPAFQTQEELCMTPPEWLTYFEENHPIMLKRYGELIKSGLTTNSTLALETWNNWRARLRKQIIERNQRVASTLKNARQGLDYALNLTQFGIYNCDQIFRLGRRSEYIYTAFNTSDGNRVYPASLSVLERNSRMFFTLPNKDQILYAPGSQLDIVVTDFKGRNYILPAEEYARIDFSSLASRNTTSITVKDVTDKTRSPKDWAELLDM